MLILYATFLIWVVVGSLVKEFWLWSCTQVPTSSLRLSPSTSGANRSLIRLLCSAVRSGKLDQPYCIFHQPRTNPILHWFPWKKNFDPRCFHRELLEPLATGRPRKVLGAVGTARGPARTTANYHPSYPRRVFIEEGPSRVAQQLARVAENSWVLLNRNYCRTLGKYILSGRLQVFSVQLKYSLSIVQEFTV